MMLRCTSNVTSSTDTHRVVRADVEGDRQTLTRVDAGAGRVQRQLPHWNAHPVGAQVAEPQYPLAVCDDDCLRSWRYRNTRRD